MFLHSRSVGRAFSSLRGFAVLFVLSVALNPNFSAAAEPVAAKLATPPARKNMELPGLVVNFREGCVDLQAVVCLDEGMLELIACTKGSKEHESIVAVEARPMHIHTALLLLGANNGNPAMSKLVEGESPRWVHVPPRGDPVDVYLVLDDGDGRMVEHPIGDFVARSDRGPRFAPVEGTGGEDDVDEGARFPNTFLFAGSRLRNNGSGPRTYLADESGNVISIATFGDELLCLPGLHATANEALMWQVDGRKLSKVGAKVTLRLRPREKPAARTDEADRQQAKTSSSRPS